MGLKRFHTRFCHSTPQLDTVISSDVEWRKNLISYFSQNFDLDLNDEKIFSDFFSHNN